MEISLANEQALRLVAQTTFEVAKVRVDDKRTNLVAGTVGALLSRPKPEEIQLISTENRLEGFWHIVVSATTVYDRNRAYSVAVSGPEVQSVTVLGQAVPVAAKAFGLNAVEHCRDDRRVAQTFDGMTGQRAELSKYLAFPKEEIADLGAFALQGVLVVPPQARATAVVRQVMTDAIKPVQAQEIHEERVDVETIDLYFRPVYAFEYEWAAKSKRVVVEYDALTNEIRSGGKKWHDEIKNVVTRDFLFDVTADAVGMIVPGGSIAVKLVKAVVDRGK